MAKKDGPASVARSDHSYELSLWRAAAVRERSQRESAERLLCVAETTIRELRDEVAALREPPPE